MSLQALSLGQWRGERQLFEDIDFSLAPGQALWVRGPNGCGKTSLLRLLCGLARPATGSVHWRGQPLHRVREAFHAELAWVGHGPGLKDDLDALENLASAAGIAGRPCGQDEALAALDALGLAPQATLAARSLSQGQRKRVSLARLCLADTPCLWVLDEPFSALDTASIERLHRRMDEHLGTGGLLVCTTHQPLTLADPARLRTLELQSDPDDPHLPASWRLH